MKVVFEMPACAAVSPSTARMPDWVPVSVCTYLAHTETGLPIRELARVAGCHASTVLRQIRRLELRRDDPLVDSGLKSLGAAHFAKTPPAATLNEKEAPRMSSQFRPQPDITTDETPDEATVMAEAGRILRRLCETGAVLAVAAEMEKAVIVRDGAGGATTRTGVVARKIAEALALKNWISADTVGKITRYKITAAGRTALSSFENQEKCLVFDSGATKKTININQFLAIASLSVGISNIDSIHDNPQNTAI